MQSESMKARHMGQAYEASKMEDVTLATSKERLSGNCWQSTAVGDRWSVGQAETWTA